MKKRVIDLRDQVPLLDIVSDGRGGKSLTPSQKEHIARTVRRVPEVVVKVTAPLAPLTDMEPENGVPAAVLPEVGEVWVMVPLDVPTVRVKVHVPASPKLSESEPVTV